jgi:hypothetical protein
MLQDHNQSTGPACVNYWTYNDTAKWPPWRAKIRALHAFRPHAARTCTVLQEPQCVGDKQHPLQLHSLTQSYSCNSQGCTYNKQVATKTTQPARLLPRTACRASLPSSAVSTWSVTGASGVPRTKVHKTTKPWEPFQGRPRSSEAASQQF